MANFTRFATLLAGTGACLALTGCGGADSVASPGAGAITIITPAPTPAPTATPTPTAPSNITAAQFAAVTAVNGISISADEQLAIVNAGANNNVKRHQYAERGLSNRRDIADGGQQSRLDQQLLHCDQLRRRAERAQ